LEKRERELDNISKELLATDGRGLDTRFQEIEEFFPEAFAGYSGPVFC
jgi:hypothetical protein